jgi:protein involved in sex pheromone biosynthesis
MMSGLDDLFDMFPGNDDGEKRKNVKNGESQENDSGSNLTSRIINKIRKKQGFVNSSHIDFGGFA